MYHLTDGHDAWQIRRNAESSNSDSSGSPVDTDPPSPPTASAQSNLATAGGVTDDFIGYGGMLLPSKD